MKIHRYELPDRVNHVVMPYGAKVVDALWQEKRGQFSIYAECDPLQHNMTKRFAVIPTGGDVPYLSTHIRSIVMPDGFHVFHIYELP